MASKKIWRGLAIIIGILVIGGISLWIISPRIVVSQNLPAEAFNSLDESGCVNRTGTELPFKTALVQIQDSHFYMVVSDFTSGKELRGELGGFIQEDGKLGILLKAAQLDGKDLSTLLIRPMENIIIPPISELVADCILQLGITDYTLHEIAVQGSELYIRFEARLTEILRLYAPQYLPFL